MASLVVDVLIYSVRLLTVCKEKQHHDAIYSSWNKARRAVLLDIHLEASIRRFQSDLVSIWGLIHIIYWWKHPVYTIVLAVVTSDGDVMPLFIFSHGLRLNTEEYIKYLGEVLLPLIETVTAGKSHIWLQDSAACHTSRESEFWLLENFCDYITTNIWLPNSSDCSPLERESNKTPWNTNDEMKARIAAAFTNLSKETVGKAYKKCRNRLEVRVEANGDFFD